ncbi:MAG: LptF/LptG family permease [Candidatus Velthaea sp.]
MVADLRDRFAALRRLDLRITILDRYLVSELVGPFLFGVSAFTLIFVATQILALARFVSDEHAPLSAAIAYFLWQMPQFMLYVIPMALLLGTLLAMQRLSGESEITAMKAGGIGLSRIVTPLLIVGLIMSVFDLVVQEFVVPLANDRAAYIRAEAIEHVDPIAGNLTVTTPLPGGGKQVTIAKALDPATQSLVDVVVNVLDAEGRPTSITYAKRARYDAPTWTFFDETSYEFAADGSTNIHTAPQTQVDIGERPDQIAKHSDITDPQQLSRADIRAALDSGQLSATQVKTYTATYASKLAAPFAAFVFTLIAVSFGLRPARGGGTGLGFGLAVAIVFIYYVISTVFLSVGELATWLAGIAAWTPNAVFTVIGLSLLRRASAV